jgi:outer membrane protein TolC
MLFVKKNHRLLLLIVIAVIAITNGCAVYQPRALTQNASLTDDLQTLRIDPRQMPLPELVAHPFDPSDGLDMTEVAMLAVVNNPDLKVARQDAKVAGAQAFAAGLLPDPQLAMSTDLRNSSNAAGATKAFSAGLSFDFASLLTLSDKRHSATADVTKTNLNLLWQEWQVVAQARLLFIRVTSAEAQLKILERNRALFADRYLRTGQALALGLLTIDAVAPNLGALQDINKQINDLTRMQNQNRHDLNALLGVTPTLVITLQGDASVPEIDAAAIQKLLPDLTRRRPDLIALEAGYAAQDYRYRAAILGQFPALNIGLTRARDSSNVYSTALGVSISLPIFNRNRGNIAIEQATRDKLYEEYQQRINKGLNEIDRLMSDQRISQQQLVEVDAGVVALTAAAKQAALALRENNLDILGFTNLRASLLTKELERAALQQAILEQRVALQALLGGELPQRASLQTLDTHQTSAP